MFKNSFHLVDFSSNTNQFSEFVAIIKGRLFYDNTFSKTLALVKISFVKG